MLKDFAWNTFEHTGNINSYFFYREMASRENAANQRNLAEEEVATGKVETPN